MTKEDQLKKLKKRTNDIYVFESMKFMRAETERIAKVLPQIGLEICVVNGHISCPPSSGHRTVTLEIYGVWSKKYDPQSRQMNFTFVSSDPEIVEKFLSKDQSIKDQANAYMVGNLFLFYFDQMLRG